MTKLTHNSMISIGLVLTLAGVIFSAGILYNKVENTKVSLSEFKDDTKEEFASLNEKIDKLIEIKIAVFPLGHNQ